MGLVKNIESGPALRTAIPGPKSRELAQRLARVESVNVTYVGDDWPVFLDAGAGAFLIDVDGNRLLDMTGCFAVMAAGHGPTDATAAGTVQLARLAHGMGDVHPTAAKVELLERLARIAPFPNARTILGCNGSDAVEAAMKTARLTTGRPGVITFTGAYHGLSYGALAGTTWPMFRQPFADQLPAWSHVATYPNPYRLGARATDQAIASVQRILDGPPGLHVAQPPPAVNCGTPAPGCVPGGGGGITAEGGCATIGAILVEPIQGRGGEVVPPDDFLPRLRDLCDQHGLLLIADEIYCGLGRSGRLWACEHVGVMPDLLLVGKALGGGFPISACIGNERAMAGWPASTGEAIHTYTFLGHPVGCVMACASLDQLVGQNLVPRAAQLGRHLLAKLRSRLARFPAIGDIRGRGLMVGIELVDPASRADVSRAVLGPGVNQKGLGPDESMIDPVPVRLTPGPGTARLAAARLTVAVMKACLRRGLLVLAGGVDGNVLSLTPPLTVTPGQLDAAVAVVAEALAEVSR